VPDFESFLPLKILTSTICLGFTVNNDGDGEFDHSLFGIFRFAWISLKGWAPSLSIRNTYRAYENIKIEKEKDGKE
jgi:hypothetical protein